MDLKPTNVIYKIEFSEFNLIEIINEPLTNSYYIETSNTYPIKISIQISATTKDFRLSSQQKHKCELSLKNKKSITPQERLFLIKMAAMNALIDFYFNQIAIGAKIQPDKFLIELSDEEIMNVSSINNNLN